MGWHITFMSPYCNDIRALPGLPQLPRGTPPISLPSTRNRWEELLVRLIAIIGVQLNREVEIRDLVGSVGLGIGENKNLGVVIGGYGLMILRGENARLFVGADGLGTRGKNPLVAAIRNEKKE
ncbi:hypothetical protein K2173_012978 [Erythroxylum novogranatense]|uniref:Uncharacterized protein n=1 Tax=Erythroxylum novogranatense TaxID=1862640 RepID=A0AAV8S7G9_9ROSI|nr:hypothetical protein K2173_012978 [Erythroxylum novogranatense]